MTSRHFAWVHTHPVTTFYLLAFSMAWTGWLPSLLASGGFSAFKHPLWAVWLLLPALGPALAARLTVGWQGHTPTPLSALFEWRVSSWWYLLAVGFPLLTVLMANGLSQYLSPGIALAPVRGNSLAAFILLSLVVNPWEEVGWRGFALRRLQENYSSFRATLLVGILWGCWHLPIFFILEGPISMAAIPILPWFVGLLGWSFVMTWLFNSSGCSLLICTLCHVAGNGFGALLGTGSFWTLALMKVGLALVLWLLFGSGLPPVFNSLSQANPLPMKPPATESGRIESK